MNANGQPDDKDLFLIQTGCLALQKASGHLTAAGLSFEDTPLSRELHSLMRQFLAVERAATRLRKNVEVSQAPQMELMDDA